MNIKNIASAYLFPFLFCMALLSCHAKKSNTDPEKFVLTDTMMNRITIDSVTEKQVITELKLVARVVPEDNKMADVYAIVGGFVTRLNVALGDFVQKGQVLASIRSSEVADFEKQKREAESRLLVAEKNYKIAMEMFESRLNTERDISDASKEVENAKSELNRINEVMKIYRISNGSYYDVVSPISGFVIDKQIANNTQIPEDFNQRIFTIAQIDAVYIKANVYETDIAKVSVGMPARIELLSYPDKIWEGRVDKILNAIDPVTKTLSILIRIPNPGFAIKPEMAATVYLSYAEPRFMPAVASESIVFDNSSNYVLIWHRRDSIETRAVELYKSNGPTSYIQSGVKKGEKIIGRNALFVYDALND